MNKKILIVEDEEVIRKSLRLILKKWGHEVTEAQDGEQAIIKLGKEDFDLIICDVMMPRKDGWQLLQEVRSSPKKGDIPIIILTAKNRDSDMFKGYELGATYFMTKPFTKGQLQYGMEIIFGGSDLPATFDISQQYVDGEEKEVLTTSKPLG